MKEIMLILKDQIPNIKRENIEIVSGGAKGADTLAEQWSSVHKIKFTRFDAQWDKLGKSAGYSRNVVMAEYAKDADKQMTIAFWDGESRGTKNMIHLSKMYRFETIIVNYKEQTFSVDTYHNWDLEKQDEV